MLACVLHSVCVQTSRVGLANDFLDSLSPEVRRAALLSFDDEYRTHFRFVPARRKGAHLGDLSVDARAKSLAWLGEHLSPTGMRQIETIRSLEDILRAAENNNPTRDKSLYAFTFFGKPASAGFWGWRYEGHHLSLNYTYKGGAMISSSPQFLGSNPAEVRSGATRGTRVLAEESDLAFELLNLLSESQRVTAVLGSRTPRSLDANLGFVTNNDRVAKIEGKAGLSFAKMTAAQQALLKKLVEAHADVQRDSVVQSRLKKIAKAGWDEVVFAWMGSTSPRADHYYRVQGPTFLIEFDNAQDQTNHIHSVWRDFDGDFGRDVLGEHLATSPHHRHDRR